MLSSVSFPFNHIYTSGLNLKLFSAPFTFTIKFNSCFPGTVTPSELILYIAEKILLSALILPVSCAHPIESKSHSTFPMHSSGNTAFTHKYPPVKLTAV